MPRWRATLLGAACSAVTATAMAGCGGAAAGALTGKTPRQVLGLATDAAVAAGGVHYQLSATQGSRRQTITGDAGVHEGDQERVTDTDDVLVELVGGTAYLRANAPGLHDTFGLAASEASRYAGMWISVSPSDSIYVPLAESVTLSGVIGQLLPTAPLSEQGPTTVDGQPVLGVRGGLPGQLQPGVSGWAVLWVDTGRPALPVAFSGEATKGTQRLVATALLSRWGEKLDLSAPPGATPWSSIPRS
jgi:hypothetical protein